LALFFPPAPTVGESKPSTRVEPLIHRDLKPANILVASRADGSTDVKLADFGISRLLDTVPDTPNTPAQAAQQLASLVAQVGELSRTRSALGQASTWQGQLQSAVTEELSSGITPSLRTTDSPVVILTPRESAKSAGKETLSGKGRRRRPSEELTQAGAILGTPLYMAPELRRGAHLALPSSDVFSFGMVAYEVLTGSLPFEQPPLLWEDLGIVAPLLIPLQKRCAGLPMGLAHTLESCLAIDPLLRPSAAALVSSLLSVLIPTKHNTVQSLGS
jgi:serine/threonine protein kinase